MSNHIKVYLLFVCCILSSVTLSAQPLTVNDEQEIRDQAKNLVTEFQDLLNLISTTSNTFEVNEMISNTYSGSRRIFDESINSIATDIDPEFFSKTNERLIDIDKYLKDFHLFYQKDSTYTISFKNIEAGRVKNNEGVIFTRVFFDSYFAGTSKSSGTYYRRTQRIAEVRAEKVNGRWKTYIVSVLFQSKNEIKDIPPDVSYKDSDNDGIGDNNDKCPYAAGPKENSGCPYSDYDKDGVPDKDDNCKYEVGPLWNKGCPVDTDGDGVPDTKDDCPNVKGSTSNRGCPYPDFDNDGVPDMQDKCPNQYGPESNNGCPLDSDGDGVTDDVDQCKYQKGPARNNGCPKTRKSASVATKSDKRGFKMGFVGLAALPVLSDGSGDTAKLTFSGTSKVLPGGGITFLIHNEQRVFNLSFGARFVQKSFDAIKGVGYANNRLTFKNLKFNVIEVPLEFYLNSRGKSCFSSAFGASFNYTLKDQQVTDPITQRPFTSNDIIRQYNLGFRFGLGYIGNFKNRGGIHLMACYSNVLFSTINQEYSYIDGLSVEPFRNITHRLGYLSLEMTLRLW